VLTDTQTYCVYEKGILGLEIVVPEFNITLPTPTKEVERPSKKNDWSN
jgi:hypothetical protein